jgi:hypothetical protein
MEALILILEKFGPLTFAVILVMVYFWDKGRAENKTENTVSDIAGSSSRELSEVHKQIGDIRQQLGMAQGQNIVLMDNLKTNEQKREASELLTKDKIYILTEKIEKQTILISRHEGRIIQLELESKQKDEIIATKEHEIVELKIDNARQKVMVETHETTISGLNRRLELVTRTQTLDDTIQLTEADLANLEDKPSTAIPIEAANKTTEETNQTKGIEAA